METRDVISDFRRRYESTYVWLSMLEQGTETLVYIDSVQDSDSKMAVLSLTSAEFGQMQVNYGSSDHVIRFKYPPVGVFQHGAEPFVFMRRPARQYRRGLCADNSTMRNVARHLVGNTARWNAAEVTAAFKHETTSYDGALERLGKEKKLKGCALPNEFSLMHSVTKDKQFILFHWENPVATVNRDNGKIIKLLEPVYEKAVNELVGVIT